MPHCCTHTALFVRVVCGPDRMITIPPRHYCVIENPVAKDENETVVMENGQAKLLHADLEIRYAQVGELRLTTSVFSYGISHQD